MKLVFATFNRGKAVEAGEILGPGYELLLPPDLGITDEVEETGSTLQENSLLKARSIWNALSLTDGGVLQTRGQDLFSGQVCRKTKSCSACPPSDSHSELSIYSHSGQAKRDPESQYAWRWLGVFADDTGLEVDALGGAPGVHTARYAGPACNFDDNIAKLLRKLEAVGAIEPSQRTARFRCVVTLIVDGEPHFFPGEMPGRIALQRSGARGFGYDPVFIPDACPDRTLAEMDLSAKDAISHRGAALRAMAAWLKEV